MIELARLVDPDARSVRKRFEDEVEAVVKQNSELIAKARFAVLGTSVYPDATATLRLSFGVVKGWEENGKTVSPITHFAGAFERATGQDPFALPPSWLAARARLDLGTPLNFCSTNDIIGGNSGSPVINQSAGNRGARSSMGTSIRSGETMPTIPRTTAPSRYTVPGSSKHSARSMAQRES